MADAIKMRALRSLPTLGVARGATFVPEPQDRLDLLQRGWAEDVTEAPAPKARKARAEAEAAQASDLDAGGEG